MQPGYVVTQLTVYPVKACSGVSIPKASITSLGTYLEQLELLAALILIAFAFAALLVNHGSRKVGLIDTTCMLDTRCTS